MVNLTKTFRKFFDKVVTQLSVPSKNRKIREVGAIPTLPPQR